MMGEFEDVCKKVVEILEEAGYPADSMPYTLYRNDKGWVTTLGIQLQFDKNGLFLKPKLDREGIENT
jgi:hypothetical protein